MILQALADYYEQLSREHPERIARPMVFAPGGFHAGAFARWRVGQRDSCRGEAGLDEGGARASEAHCGRDGQSLVR